jgi:class 3 adenylate cyclase/HAMP domain-containing protein
VSIRLRIVLIVLPLIITSLLIAEIATSLYARNGITAVATQFLKFKSEQLNNYAESQWAMLIENDLTENEAFREAMETAVASFADSLLRSDTEKIYTFDETGNPVFTSGRSDTSAEPGAGDLRAQDLVGIEEFDLPGWKEFTAAGTERVAWVSRVDSLDWYVYVTEARDTFYQAVDKILMMTVIVIIAASAVSVGLLLVFSHYLVLPLRKVVAAMREIISTSDLSKRVEVIYRDETGELGHSFNLMTGELEKAYDQIKGYALKAVIAQHKEQKIRNIFQKYVPTDVIDQFFENPEAMLIGQDRILAVLFSDIRSFTSISEKLKPNEIVESLNQYFSRMVEIIMNRRGIVDKYIGDAIMAFYGAPVRHEDDALQATLSALDMIDALESFNEYQIRIGRPEFKIGIGLNYGLVTVGNIGSEKKMDYTVIGDMVNLASRLEGLTKQYGCPLIVSASVHRKIKDKLPCRLLDRVTVKGKEEPVGIYSVQRSLTPREGEGWEKYASGIESFYGRDFRKAAGFFHEATQLIPGDVPAELFYSRAEEYILSPPEDWKDFAEFEVK